MRERPTTRRNLIAALDIGTTKIACLIAKHGDDGQLTVTGVGHQLARGIKSGVITDVAEAGTSIAAAVHTAEQMSGETIENIIDKQRSGLIIPYAAVNSYY